LHVRYKMECKNEDENAWPLQIWHSQLVKATLFQPRIEAFQLLSQPKMQKLVKSTVVQLEQEIHYGESTIDQ